MKKNKVKEILSNENGVAFGTWIQMASAETAELAAYAGFDFVLVDTEHGYFGLDTAINVIRAIESGGATPVLRLPDDNPSTILKVLDAGVLGILIPGITNKEQAERVVQSAKYSPKGHRGSCPHTRATGHGLYPWKEYVEWANSETMVWLLIEGVEGVNNIDEILTVEGVDVIVLGPFDLSQSLCLEGQIDHPEVVKKLKSVAEKARLHGKEVVAVLFDEDNEGMVKSAKKWMENGCRILTSGSDRAILAKKYHETITALREL